MDRQEVLQMVRSAFVDVRYPGDENIIHCEHDQRWGGSLEGPCRECEEVISFFRGKGNSSLDVEYLEWLAFGLASFTPQAFRYWLVAFIEAATIHPPEVAGRIRESLEFRLSSGFDSEAKQRACLSGLSAVQITAVINFFRHARPQGMSEVEAGNIISNIERLCGK